MSLGRSQAAGNALKPDFQIGRSWLALKSFLQGPCFAYFMLALLQLRVVWGMWRYRDLTDGDTSAYFLLAFRWFSDGTTDMVWSPLYTMFYGSLLYLFPDPYPATVLHRLLIVFAASLLVLAVLRRLLPPALAWLAAVWWAVLPINFNTLYEVHLFALLPSLVVWLLLLSSARRWARGAALAILCGSAVLVRNELLLAAILLGGACAVWEWRGFRRPGGSDRMYWRSLIVAYGAPLIVVAGVCACGFAKSHQSYAEMKRDFNIKHTLNMAQVFTFGFEQRHSECTCSPWTEFQEVMTPHFGEPTPSLSTMLRRNPRAVAAHFWWNWQLAPNGLQVLLFNATSGTKNPDYVPVTARTAWPKVLTVLMLACWIAGLKGLVHDWGFWWNTWLRPRLWGWVGMLAVVAVTIPVITTQRPRPSYLFTLSVFVMAVTGMSLWIVTHRWRWTRRVSQWMPLVMASLTALVGPYYDPLTADVPASVAARPPRPLHDLTRRLLPYEAALPRQGSVALVGDNAYQVSAYVWKGRLEAVDYGILERDWRAGTPLEQFLAERNVGAVYLSERMIRQLESQRPNEARAFLGDQLPPGWRELGGGDAPGDRWKLVMQSEP
jgi:hypothetical protein